MFRECSSLTSVNINELNQLATIDKYVFKLSGLNGSITLPASVTSINKGAFESCSNLSGVNFASGSQLESIGDYVFKLSGLKIITLPASLTTIGSYAFWQCSNLTTVMFDIGSQLPSIGTAVFGNSYLTVFIAPQYVLDAFNVEAGENKTVGGKSNVEVFLKSNPIVACVTSPITITVASTYVNGTSTYKYITSDTSGNGGLFGCIHAVRGSTITIYVVGEEVELETHPLRITEYNDQGQAATPLTGVVKTDLTEGPNEDGTYSLTWTVPDDPTIDKYQYQCETHAHMRGTINVSDPDSTNSINVVEGMNNIGMSISGAIQGNNILYVYEHNPSQNGYDEITKTTNVENEDYYILQENRGYWVNTSNNDPLSIIPLD